MRNLSKITLAFAIYIIISASFILQIRNFLINILGQEIVDIVFIAISLLIVSLYLVYTYQRAHIFVVILSSFIFILAYFLIQAQPFFAEKIHVLEYGILGYLAFYDLSKKDRKIYQYIFQAIIFVFLIGVIDEVFQGILPYRFGDVRDVLTNIVSGFLGIVLRTVLTVFKK